jgi:hypothetical protein
MRSSITSVLLAAILAACGTAPPSASPRVAAADPETPTVCGPLAAPARLPGTRPEDERLESWLSRTAEVADLDAPLLTVPAVRAQNRAVALDPEQGLPTDRGSLSSPPPTGRLDRELTARLAYLREKAETGTYVDRDGSPVDPSTFRRSGLRRRPTELRVALAPISLRCAPRLAGLYRAPVDLDFDRNGCSTIRPQEAVQVLGAWRGDLLLVRTRYALGWVGEDAPLSPPVDPARWLPGGRARVEGVLEGEDGARFEGGAWLPVTAEDRVLFADREGLHEAPRAPELTVSERPLTRRALLAEAFSRLGQPYGWGGANGGLDCSRFVMDVLGAFGLELPRHSGRQAATAGTFALDLDPALDDAERLRLLDAAHREGAVLLHFPGHIMLYLGRAGDGSPMAIHAFSEYLEPCDDGGDRLRRADRVAVTTLELGRGTERRSFLERLTRLVVLGPSVGPELAALARPRPAAPVEVPASCEDSLEVRVFHSPAVPNPTQPLRVLVTSQRALGPVELGLFDPDGRRVEAETRRLGGGPTTYWAEVARPAAGPWTAVLGDGPDVAACETVRVRRGPPRPPTPDADAVWRPRWRWEADTEALYSAFVEQLFNFPLDEDRTWRDLDALLQDPQQNLLHGHLSQREESRIHLRPDCADLPYFLRVYFAWKMRLPFGYRRCTRGRRGRLPVCTELLTPRTEHGYTDEVEAFHHFIRREVKRAVHSASGRTHPRDDDTALYPVPLTREALRPGTVFADPYGHLLVVARWVPQGPDGYGILVGADAQPDGTIGRRRFWRGSFLFHPDTEHVGAGFKAWRPVLYHRREDAYESLPNERITARGGYVPFSMEQYEGTTDDFYERMEALINPRALDPWVVQRSLIDALEEAVARRLVSVDNGEAWVAEHPGRTMEMPEGGAIFQTGGPWEEYSTPSRDMRLLIAVDTVTAFPDVLRRRPERFGVPAAEAAEAAASIRARQEEELAARRFAYRRSDGVEQPLSLADVVARARRFEVAYNPNDCVEIRWGAPLDGPEMASCRRRAPGFQRERMARYREWFEARRRPLW